MISVVTIVHDRPEQLTHLIRGLLRCTPLPDELVVVDMGSTPQVGELVQGLASAHLRCTTVRIDDGDGRLPLARARNVGGATARGDRLVFLDVDCIPAPDLVGSYRAAPHSSLVCAPVRYLRQGWDAPTVDLDPVHLFAASDAHPLRLAPPMDACDDRYELFWSLSFATDRETFVALHGFDERYVGYGAEDTDFGFAARRACVPLVWLAHGCAFHQWHPSQQPPVQHLEAIVANARTFRTSWGRWPMEGWLGAFAARGLIEWHRDSDVVTIVSAD
ncbi:MAG: glycosyltransferase [Ilumatobacteraceae bacterium]